MNDSATLVTILIYLVLLFLILAFFYYRYKVKTKRYEAMIRIAEIGGKVDSELLSSLGDKQRTQRDDFRSAVIWCAVGLPIFVGGSLEERELSSSILFAIPLFISTAYYIIAKYKLRGTGE